MRPAALTARTLALWESLAGAPAAFSPAVRVSVSPQSRICPPPGAAAVERVGLQDDGLRSFLSECDAADAEEGGIGEITSPAFAVRERGKVIAPRASRP